MRIERDLRAQLLKYLALLFPARERDGSVPHRGRQLKQFAPGTVKLAGKAVAASIAAHNVTVTVPPPKGVLCSMLGPGSVTLVFTTAAGLRNPARPGSYRFRATHARHTFSARLAVKPAA